MAISLRHFYPLLRRSSMAHCVGGVVLRACNCQLRATHP
jgi:hypothetical protein